MCGYRCAWAISLLIWFSGKVGRCKVKESGLFAVPHTFVQRACEPPQPGLQLLADVSQIAVDQELNRRLYQIVGSRQQFVSHASSPAMHPIGAGHCRPQGIKTFVRLEQRFRCSLKIIGASVLRLLENQQIGVNRVNRRDRDRILPTKGRQFEPCQFVVRVLTKG